jgi:hypothetical protein
VERKLTPGYGPGVRWVPVNGLIFAIRMAGFLDLMREMSKIDEQRA